MRLLQKALTFDDVLLVPAHSQILPRDVSLATRLTRNITLNLPLLSAAMDTVTEGRLAIALAQEGGIGIIHKNLPARAQAAEVSKVKRHEAGILQIRHDIADGRRGQLQAGITREGAGTDRSPVGDVMLDQGLEQGAGAFIKHGGIVQKSRAAGARRSSGFCA